MTTDTDALTCPSCGEPITAANLKRDGKCPACMDIEFGTVPVKRPPEKAETAGPDTAGPEPVSGADYGHGAGVGPSTPDEASNEVAGEAASSGAESDQADEALAMCLGVLQAIHSLATQANAEVFKVEGDELCNALGKVYDACIAGAAGILDVLVDDWREQVGA